VVDYGIYDTVNGFGNNSENAWTGMENVKFQNTVKQSHREGEEQWRLRRGDCRRNSQTSIGTPSLRDI
jgi:hypothetical protein